MSVHPGKAAGLRAVTGPPVDEGGAGGIARRGTTRARDGRRAPAGITGADRATADAG